MHVTLTSLPRSVPAGSCQQPSFSSRMHVAGQGAGGRTTGAAPTCQALVASLLALLQVVTSTIKMPE
jgi:hypothetical protein